MKVISAKTDSDLLKVSKILLEFRPGFNLENLIAQIKEQQKNGYQIVYIESENRVICICGFVIGLKLAWGKHLYVDDLVTDEPCRSAGAGKFMIDWLKSYAGETGCRQIHLDTRVHRFPAHRFYLREGFNIASHHFSITTINDNLVKT